MWTFKAGISVTSIVSTFFFLHVFSTSLELAQLAMAADVPQLRIVGGEDSSLGKWPWQGMFLKRKSAPSTHSLICGCSLINTRWVVTAAHCSYRISVSDILVRFGVLTQSSSESGAEDYAILSKVEHPEYSSETLKNDISLLKTSKQVGLTINVQPVSLPSQGVKVGMNAVCWITGWGSTNVSSTAISNVLQEAQVPIISNALCDSWFTRITLAPTQLCAGKEEGGVDTCRGDSGGPLVCWDKTTSKYILQGITSFGVGCGDPRQPGIYTRVSEFADWINATAPGGADPLSKNSILVAFNSICVLFCIALLL